MKTAIECLENAARCEHNAEGAKTRTNRLSLLDAAQSWRMLAREAAKTQDVPASPGTERTHIRS